MRFPAKIASSCIWVAIPVDWVILHWYMPVVWKDGRSIGVRSRDFLGWEDYHIFLPMVLRYARFALESSVMKTNHV